MAEKQPPSELIHGTGRAYKYWKCRCTDCRAWAREASAARRVRYRNSSAPIPHGTQSGYDWYACRCEACKSANSSSRRGRRKRRNLTDDRRRQLADYQLERQVETLPKALKSGRRWTGPELEILVIRQDLSAIQLASMLGRTYHAVCKMRERCLTEPKYRKWAGVDDA